MVEEAEVIKGREGRSSKVKLIATAVIHFPFSILSSPNSFPVTAHVRITEYPIFDPFSLQNSGRVVKISFNSFL